MCTRRFLINFNCCTVKTTFLVKTDIITTVKTFDNKSEMDFVLPKIEESANTDIYLSGGQIDEREFRHTAAELRFGELVQQRIDNGVLNSSNCLAIWAQAKRYDFDEVKGLATNIAFENFMDIVNSNQFKYMGIDLLSEFLSNDNINVDSEEDVFHALVIWLEYDLINRLSHVPRLIQNVRVGQLNRSVSISI